MTRFRRIGAAVLGLALLFAPLPAMASAAVDPVDRWRVYIGEASLRFGIPSDWIVEVMRAESGGHTMRGRRPIRSAKGAIGLMQLMPGTWADMRARLGLGADPDEPHDNILAGAGYLRLMYDRFGYPGLFAAYNAGTARYAAYLSGQANLPRETIAYLTHVSSGPPPRSVANSVPQPAQAEPRDPLFAVRATTMNEAKTPPVALPAPPLFAIPRDNRPPSRQPGEAAPLGKDPVCATANSDARGALNVLDETGHEPKECRPPSPISPGVFQPAIPPLD